MSQELPPATPSAQPSPAQPSSGSEPDTGSGGSKPLWRRWWFALGVVVVAGLVLSSFVPTGPVATVFALLLGVTIFRVGWFFLQSFATPPPPPPDPGTLRKVKLVYRCPTCGTQVRMTAAVTEEPEPPRHCMEEMELISGLD